MVVLNPSTAVLEAARAIESNEVGAVLVQEKGHVAGIVTDRDLTVRVVGRGLDPQSTPLSAVMTTAVATLSPKDSQRDAIRLMQERNVRRIPLVEEGRLVGMVTLDDLLLDEAADIEDLAAIVQSQIGAGGPRSPVRERHRARAESTYGRLINQLRADTGLDTVERVNVALEVVLRSLVRRLTPNEAKDLVAQLPSLLHPTLQALPPGPDKLITRETIEAELIRQLGVDRPRAAQLLAIIGGTIAERVSPGQMEHVRGQLPEELRGVFASTLSPVSS
jgi:uncharacterized protein (DUF2267 family)